MAVEDLVRDPPLAVLLKKRERVGKTPSRPVLDFHLDIRDPARRLAEA
jgi:hypothetical protein